jgi:hypothetical protein
MGLAKRNAIMKVSSMQSYTTKDQGGEKTHEGEGKVL